MKKSIKFAPPIAGALAQLVEQRTENPCVPGSIPGGTTSRSPDRNVRTFLFLIVPQQFNLSGAGTTVAKRVIEST